MKKNILLLIISILTACGAYAQVTLKLGSVENAEPGTYIQVPIIASGLSASGYSFIGMQINFSFQGNVLTYDAIAEGNPTLPLGEWIAGSNGGQAAANWFEPGFEPTNVEDNSTILIFIFYYGGGQTDLAFDESVTEIYANTNGDLVPIASFIGGTVTQAQGSESSIWNGTGFWATPGNWSNGIPGDSTNAVISTGETEISSGAVCRNLTLNSGSKLVIQPGKSLSVNGNLTNDGEIAINTDSLVQGSLIIHGIINQSGTSKMAKNIYNGVNYGVSSPVLNETADIFDGMGNEYYYSEGTNELITLTSSYTLERGNGYILESNTTDTVVFEGTFNNSTVDVNLPFSNEGWNFVGNPFTCSIVADNLVTMENTDRAIYIWDNNRFLVWNGTAGTIPNGIIPPLTGFFVKANASNARIIFNKDAKIHDFSHFNSSYTAPENVLQLNLWDFDNNVYLDEAFVQIEPSSTLGYDGTYDAIKLDYLWDCPQLFINDSENNHQAIAAIPAATEVTMGINILADGAYTIKNPSPNFMPDKNVFLIDQELAITKNLREEDYTFLANEGLYPDRFILVMSGLGTNDFEEETGLLVYSNQEKILIQSINDLGKSIIKVYDLNGRLISQTEDILEPGKLVTLRGSRGLNIVRIETSVSVFPFKVFIR
jgi:hypothetical protein